MTTQGTAESYRVFVRNWWRREWYGHGHYSKLVPDPSAPKKTIIRHCTESEARRFCAEYNATHKPGPLSRKAEFEKE